MIAWTDLETTGLDERVGNILEVAFVITDDNLEEKSHFSCVVNVKDIAPMDAIVREMHTVNGLFKEMDNGKWVRDEDLEDEIVDWFIDQGPIKELKKVPLAGSTVGFDRRWIRHHLPNVEAMFSYRSIDVSSITELVKRFAPDVYEKRPRAENPAHRALADVRESIAILKFYREHFFKTTIPAVMP